MISQNDRLLIGDGPRCFCCGKPLESEDEEYCVGCQTMPHSFTMGRSLLKYKDQAIHSMMQIKYNNKREYLETFAGLLADRYIQTVEQWAPDYIVPIPMYRAKMRRRGFNQAAILADYFGELLNLPVENKLLKKIIDTREQKELSMQERMQNLREAFVVEEELYGDRILLVDDVFTTGSTLDAAASVLRAAGASDVYFLTICMAGV